MTYLKSLLNIHNNKRSRMTPWIYRRYKNFSSSSHICLLKGKTHEQIEGVENIKVPRSDIILVLQASVLASNKETLIEEVMNFPEDSWTAATGEASCWWFIECLWKKLHIIRISHPLFHAKELDSSEQVSPLSVSSEDYYFLVLLFCTLWVKEVCNLLIRWEIKLFQQSNQESAKDCQHSPRSIIKHMLFLLRNQTRYKGLRSYRRKIAAVCFLPTVAVCFSLKRQIRSRPERFSIWKKKNFFMFLYRTGVYQKYENYKSWTEIKETITLQQLERIAEVFTENGPANSSFPSKKRSISNDSSVRNTSNCTYEGKICNELLYIPNTSWKMK